MATHDLIVVGASSGGIEALCKLVGGLPADLPAAVFVVLHISRGRSAMPEILRRAGRLQLSFDSLYVNHSRIDLRTRVVSLESQEEGRETARKAGIGATGFFPAAPMKLPITAMSGLKILDIAELLP